MRTEEQVLKEVIKEKDKQISVLTNLYTKEREISLNLEDKVNIYNSLLKQYMNILTQFNFEKINNLIIQTGLIMETKGDF